MFRVLSCARWLTLLHGWNGGLASTTTLAASNAQERKARDIIVSTGCYCVAMRRFTTTKATAAEIVIPAAPPIPNSSLSPPPLPPSQIDLDVEKVLRSLKERLQTKSLAVRDLAKYIPDELLERICEEFRGGLASYFKQNKTIGDFSVTVTQVDTPTRLEVVSWVVTPPRGAVAPPPPPVINSPVESYNAHRLARHLKNTEFRPIEELRSLVQGIDEDVLVIARSYSDRFVLDDPQSPTAIKYKLRLPFSMRCTPVEKYTGKSIEELDALLANSKRERAFRQVRIRRDIHRAKSKVLFPEGTPFWDEDVLMYFIYDEIIPSSMWVVADTIVEALNKANISRYATYNASLQPAIFQAYPHLFLLHSDPVNSAFRIAKAEVTNTDDPPNTMANEPADYPLTDIQCLELTFQSLPRNFDSARSVSMSTLVLKAPVLFRKTFAVWLRRHARERYPHVIRLDPTRPGDFVFIDADKLQQVLQDHAM